MAAAERTGFRHWLAWTATLNIFAVCGFGVWWLSVQARALYVYAYRPSYWVAEYHDFWLSMNMDGDQFVKLRSDNKLVSTGQPELILRLADDKITCVQLRKLTEVMVASIASNADGWEIYSREVPTEKSTSYSFFQDTFLHFDNGKLVSFTLGDSVEGITFSSSREGPFISLPASKEQVLELFGEPRRWKKVKSGRGV